MKNNLWFRHDFGARNDPKLKRLISRKGPGAGYIWWVLIEMLNEEGGLLPRDYYEEIAYDTHSKVELVRYVVEESGLFKFDDTYFWSERQRREQDEAERIREQKRQGGLKSGEARRSYRGENKDQLNNSSTRVQDVLNESETPLELNKQTYKQTNEDKNIEANASTSVPEGGELFPEETNGLNPQEVVDLWNDIVEETKVSLPKVKSLSEERKKGVRARLRAFGRVGEPMAVCEEIIRKACASSFFVSSRWATFDWIFCCVNNWNKIYDGNYDDRPDGKADGHDRLRVKVTSPEDYEGEF